MRQRLVRATLAVLLVLCLLAGVSTTALGQSPFTLAVLHTGDTHAHIESFTPSGQALQGGVARRYTAIQGIRAEGGNVLLVDAFQGTLFFNQWQGEEEAYFMNALGYQAMAIGNHEFDSGPGTLGSFIRSVDFPVLAAFENGVFEYEQGTGRFPQVGGLRFAFDPSAPVGSRVTAVEIENGDGSFSPLDPARPYRVVTNDFVRKGGDGYTVFAEHASDVYDGGAVLADAVADYVPQNSPVKPAIEGRIVVGALESSQQAVTVIVTPAPHRVAEATVAALLPTTGAASADVASLPWLACGGALLAFGAAAWRRVRAA
ncbi:MAG: 5'-nucleotidase C-terminal domain-containing protein [Anaerolineae bacterium]